MKSTYVYYPSDLIQITTDTNLRGLIAPREDSRNFDVRNANFCVSSDDLWAASESERRLVRIHAGANNASGVELFSNSKKEGFCNGND